MEDAVSALDTATVGEEGRHVLPRVARDLDERGRAGQVVRGVPESDGLAELARVEVLGLLPDVQYLGWLGHPKNVFSESPQNHHRKTRDIILSRLHRFLTQTDRSRPIW